MRYSQFALVGSAMQRATCALPFVIWAYCARGHIQSACAVAPSIKLHMAFCESCAKVDESDYEHDSDSYVDKRCIVVFAMVKVVMMCSCAVGVV